MRPMTRSRTLRAALGWSQARLADYLGLTQSAVSDFEVRQSESGPVSRLLDLLAREHGLDHLTAEAFAAAPDSPEIDAASAGAPAEPDAAFPVSPETSRPAA